LSPGATGWRQNPYRRPQAKRHRELAEGAPDEFSAKLREIAAAYDHLAELAEKVRRSR
jgi:hypothetical protein